jgi:cytochrome c oxidase subunit 2
VAALGLGILGAVVVAPSAPAASIFRPESVPAERIDVLARLILGVCAAIFTIVAGVLVYCLVRFRARKHQPRTEPPQIYGSGPVEIAWTVVPLLIVFVLFLVTARTIFELDPDRLPQRRIELEVTGHQWWWEVRYLEPNRVTIANEIHLPLAIGGRPVPSLLTLRSEDVIHSFWVPELAGKIDLIPGRTNQLWIEPQRSGSFVGQCAEFCGAQHAKMGLRVVVEPERDWRRWLDHQGSPAAPTPAGAKRGRALFEGLACVSCHTVRGTAATGRVGPDLTHLMSRTTLGAGAAPNDRDSLRQWIESPDHFKPGVRMPAMRLDPDARDSLVAYLVTLR